MFASVCMCVRACDCCGMLLCLTKNSILAGPCAYSHRLNTEAAQLHLARRQGCTLPALFAADPALYRVGSACLPSGLPCTRRRALKAHRTDNPSKNDLTSRCRSLRGGGVVKSCPMCDWQSYFFHLFAAWFFTPIPHLIECLASCNVI